MRRICNIRWYREMWERQGDRRADIERMKKSMKERKDGVAKVREDE